jgi:lipopolysaccharide/colanic/teichoic acid biosynthesis glycosyltransferase
MSTKLKASRNKALMNSSGLSMSLAEWINTLPSSGQRGFHRTLEYCFALVLFAAALPVMALAALVVKLTSRGPAFYSQTRIGRNGRPYLIYKLRSMRHDCEKLSGPCWSTAGDPRITRVGRVLRLTHIDELPQLWNVLRGEMSLVGPRPERPEFIPQLAEAVPLYRSRLLVRPGVTGLAQVQLPADTDLESVRKKIAYDLYYVQNGSLWLDLRVVLATGLHVLGVPYASIGRWLGLPTQHVTREVYEDLVREIELYSTRLEIRTAKEPERRITVEMAPCV